MLHARGLKIPSPDCRVTVTAVAAASALPLLCGELFFYHTVSSGLSVGTPRRYPLPKRVSHVSSNGTYERYRGFFIIFFPPKTDHVKTTNESSFFGALQGSPKTNVVLIFFWITFTRCVQPGSRFILSQSDQLNNISVTKTINIQGLHV